MTIKDADTYIQDDGIYQLLHECGIINISHEHNAIVIRSYDGKNKVNLSRSMFRAMEESCREIIKLLNISNGDLK